MNSERSLIMELLVYPRNFLMLPFNRSNNDRQFYFLDNNTNTISVSLNKIRLRLLYYLNYLETVHSAQVRIFHNIIFFILT